MKVSIWQQWASNHSAAFTVMGKFNTPDEAQRVGGILKDILREVARWKQQDPNWQAFLAARQIQWPLSVHRNEFEIEYQYEFGPTEIERQLASLYNVQWPRTLEYALDPAIVIQAVRVIDRAVIVAEDLIGDYSETGYRPFEELLWLLDGEVAVFSEDGSSIQVTIRCTTPNDTTAKRLMQHVQHRGYRAREIRIDGLVFEGSIWSEWVRGHVQRDGLTLTYTYRELEHGRCFIALLTYLRSQGCTSIDYRFDEV